MENSKPLTADQLDQLKTTVRQRFDDLYHRIGTNRQKLANTVLLVDQSINKELTKEKIDTAREKQILNKIREVEREASKQLPHLPKVITSVPSTPKEKPMAKPKAEEKSKPEKKEKPKAEPKAKPKKK